MNYREELSAAQFLIAVAEYGINNHLDRRLAVGTGMSEATGAAGGFLAPDLWSESLWQNCFESGEILKRCGQQIVTKPGNALNVPAISETSRVDGSRWGGIVMYWLGENTTPPTTTKLKLASLRFILKKLIGLCYVTDELLQDAPALESTLSRLFGLEAIHQIESKIVAGGGQDGPLGILNSTALITVNKESGQAAATISGANILAMWARLPAACRKNAVWLTSVEAEPQLAKLYTPITNVAGTENVGGVESGLTYYPRGAWGNEFATLMGSPVIPCEHVAAVGTVGDILLSDLSQYLLAVKSPNFISSTHWRFLEDETVFRARFRCDGHSAWASPLTRKVSGITESPFIALQSRT